jgi:serine/threonine-protein kinase
MHPLARKACRPQAGTNFLVRGDNFVLGGSVGDGAAGLVRKATRSRDEKQFAIKFLAPDPKYIDESSFDDVAARFKREGERGCRLDHPYLLKLHAFVERSDSPGMPTNPFILMDYLPGKTLESLIRRTDQSDVGKFRITQERLRLAVHLAQALEYLHAKKLVHRDVKPANVFLSNRTGEASPILGDFGIMKWGDFHASLTTGVLTATSQRGLGTIKYMSPEQAIRPREVSVRSDVYSLAITLFELFTGQILAGPHNVFELMMARLQRGTTISRYSSIGYNISAPDERIAELLLDMQLRGADGRPSIDKVRGALEWHYENRFENDPD